jgi:hypothetical protein
MWYLYVVTFDGTEMTFFSTRHGGTIAVDQELVQFAFEHCSAYTRYQIKWDTSFLSLIEYFP